MNFIVQLKVHVTGEDKKSPYRLVVQFLLLEPLLPKEGLERMCISFAQEDDMVVLRAFLNFT